MSGGYIVRFVGGPADGETRELPVLLNHVKVPVHKVDPLLVPMVGTPYAPAVAVYTLVRRLDGTAVYQHWQDLT